MTTWLLVTDVDDTLIGDDDALDRFVTAVGGAPLRIVLNSSRPVASVRRSMEELEIEVPHEGVIGALGTEIEVDGVSAKVWDSRFEGFDPDIIDRALAPFDAIPHRSEYQRPHKRSFAVDKKRWSAAIAALGDIRPAVRVITSGHTNFDVIPAHAGKGVALRFVAEALDVPPDRVMAAGDSENDLDALVHAHAILVGNATPGLRAAIDDGEDRVWRTFQASAMRADGLLEGLEHYGVPLTTQRHP